MLADRGKKSLVALCNLQNKSTQPVTGCKMSREQNGERQKPFGARLEQTIGVSSRGEMKGCHLLYEALDGGDTERKRIDGSGYK